MMRIRISLLAPNTKAPQKIMKLYQMFLLSALLLGSCDTTDTSNIEGNTQSSERDIEALRNDFFEKTKITSTEVLNKLASFADNVREDTANYVRTPKAKLYVSNSTNSYFQVFEHPQGTITAVAYYSDGKRINAAEYFDNGQIMCRFSTTESGQRNGGYECYNEDGTYRLTGFYRADHEIKDSLKRYD